MRPPQFVMCLILVLLSVCSLEAQSPGNKEDHLGAAEGILMGGNGIYTVHVQDGGGACGRWTATTGPLHPAGPGLNVLFGNGSPGTSNTTLRSYTSGTDYVTGSSPGPATCLALCTTVAPVVTPILNGATTVGFRLLWSFTDMPGGPALQLEQEVVVEGPVNGTETVENSVVRETHTVRNVGPGSLTFGLRKQWDWQIGGDDGPLFGACSNPTQACDVSMNLTANGSLSGPYPTAYVMNEDPAVIACPAGITPIGTSCGGNPPYLVAGTVAPPSTLTPAPDAPEVLQFNSWPSLIGTCWQPALVNNATCAGGDTAVAYFYGLTPATAITLAAGQSRSLTQYISAAQNGCPGIVQGPEEPIPTLNEWGLMALLTLLLGSAVLLLRRRRGLV